MSTDEALNVVFFVFHTCWILFNAVGWLWRQTRLWHLLTVTLTAASWFILGARYGWGYCVFTDWHWSVRERLGYDDPDSYMQLLISELLQIEVTALAADTLTGVSFAFVTVLTLLLNARDYRRRRLGDRVAAGRQFQAPDRAAH